MKGVGEDNIGAFIALGERLEGFGDDPASRGIIARAERENGWFTPFDIRMAVEAIRSDMLSEEALRQWAEAYPVVSQAKDVGVIMAGNIPLVGFLDLLCVVASGDRCHIKPSSKDSVLINYVVALLREIDPEVAIFDYSDQSLDAIIATGSDNTNRYFRSRYASLPAIFRGSRTSVAILTGSETNEQLEGLASDVFSYSGLGCRNVSRLFVAKGYDFGRLIEVFSAYRPVNPKYINNFRQRSAILKMEGVPAMFGNHFIIRQSDSLPEAISEITYSYYHNNSELASALKAIDDEIQCIVCDTTHPLSHPRAVGFGESQRPTLREYPDGVDVMDFLVNLSK